MKQQEMKKSNSFFLFNLNGTHVFWPGLEDGILYFLIKGVKLHLIKAWNLCSVGMDQGTLQTRMWWEKEEGGNLIYVVSYTRRCNRLNLTIITLSDYSVHRNMLVWWKLRPSKKKWSLILRVYIFNLTAQSDVLSIY